MGQTALWWKLLSKLMPIEGAKDGFDFNNVLTDKPGEQFREWATGRSHLVLHKMSGPTPAIISCANSIPSVISCFLSSFSTLVLSRFSPTLKAAAPATAPAIIFQFFRSLPCPVFASFENSFGPAKCRAVIAPRAAPAAAEMRPSEPLSRWRSQKQSFRSS